MDKKSVFLNKDIEALQINRNDFSDRKKRWQLCQEFSDEIDRWPLLADFPFEQVGFVAYPSLDNSRDPEWLLKNSFHRLVKPKVIEDDSLPVMWLRSREITVTLPQAFGCQLYTDPDSPPQIIPNITTMQQLESLTEPDINKCPACMETFDIIKQIQAILGDKGYITSTTNTGATLSILSMIADNVMMFLCAMDAPDIVHCAMKKVQQAVIQYRQKEQEVLNYQNESYMGFGNYSPGGIYRMWDATGMMLNPELYIEFCRKYWEELFELFGGGVRQLSPGDEIFLEQILKTKNLKIIQPEAWKDKYDVKKTTQMAHDNGVMVEWRMEQPFNSLTEFEDWIAYMRKETGNPKSGVALILNFASLELAKAAAQRWKELN